MPPSKRKPRRSRATDLQLDTSDVEMQDSSPSRPSAKKRKGNHGRATKKEKGPAPDRAAPPPPEESDDEPDDGSQVALVDKVIANLAVSKEPVVVAADHANEGADEHKVSAFAKIAGRDWTFYVREMTINIGRPPDDKQAHPIAPGASSPAQDLKESFPVHIDLGPSKIVSRHHASIFYDAEWPQDEGGWHVRVNGRNGVRVNNTLLRRGHRQQIRSGTVLEVAGTQIMFVTPTDKVEIDPYFVDKAEAAEHGGDLEQNATASENEAKPIVATDLPMYQTLAPAPPNFARASTPPPPHEHRGQQGVFDSKPRTSPMYGRGMMMESTQEIDYSRDAAKDLKPPYSYAHMIAQAIFSSDDQKLTLSNIYSFIAEKYAFYRHSNSGWQNSIRHNLSLNKAFQKVPRRTDEPGKGMKWQIAPEFRDEYWKKQQRRVGTSSNPSSPASKTDVNPNFRGANGQNLGYDTSMVYQFSAKDATNPAAAPPKLNMTFPPYPGQGQPFPGGASGPSSQPVPPTSTPQRRRANTGNTVPDSNLDDSPMAPGPPQSFPSSAPRPSPSASQPFYTLPPNGPPPHHSPTNPMLSSSYLDTPFHPSQASSLLTPAPLRQNPKLAPPSTLVAPSKFMPESSPAGPGLFWKGFLGGFTPGPQSAIPPDMSPEKLDPESRPRRRHDLEDRDMMSSSPPPMDGEAPGMASPTKGKVGRSRGGTTTTTLRSPLNDTGAKLNGAVGAMTTTTSRASSSDTRPASSASAAAPTSTSLPPQVGTHPPPPLPPPPPPLSPLAEPMRPSGSSRLSLGPSDAGGVFNLNPGPPSKSVSPDKPLRAGTEGKMEGDDADGDGDDGFDLAKGFAPIGRGRGSIVRS